MKNFFFDLTPDIVLKAIEGNGYEPTGHCMALNSYENRVYDIRLEGGSHIIAKFYRPGRWSREQIQEEHDFLLELKEDEIPVCAPIVSSDGETIHLSQGIMYALWERTGGRAADEFSDEDLGNLGRLLARIHNMGSVKTSARRMELTGETYGLNPLQYLLEGEFLPDSCRDRYSKAVREIVDIYEKLSRDVPCIRIHGDCHPGNLLRGDSGFFFLDFDDFLMGPAVQDMWMLFPGRDNEAFRQREVMLDAYRLFRDFDDSWLSLIEPLRALRYVHYAAWIARRWEDPAFPEAFSFFGTREYWEKETEDLEDQLDYIYGKSEELFEGREVSDQEEEEKELTNRDFFWDWEE